ncbi:MAG TPA: type II toxin-antitoxin system VapC family toxin [Thermoanaerobaculia bacterium]
MIFLDSNVPMYLVGAPHSHKRDAQQILERLLAEEERLVTDAEVLQEILHRYVAIDRRDAIQPTFDALLGIADEVLPVELADVESAKRIVLGSPKLSARDALHLAVMERQKIARIFSFDTGFDDVPGIARLAR